MKYCGLRALSRKVAVELAAALRCVREVNCAEPQPPGGLNIRQMIVDEHRLGRNQAVALREVMEISGSGFTKPISPETTMPRNRSQCAWRLFRSAKIGADMLDRP